MQALLLFPFTDEPAYCLQVRMSLLLLNLLKVNVLEQPFAGLLMPSDEVNFASDKGKCMLRAEVVKNFSLSLSRGASGGGEKICLGLKNSIN